MKFPGFTKEELPNEVLIIEIKGLGLEKDLNPNSDTVGCVMVCQGKSDSNEKQTTMSTKMFLLQLKFDSSHFKI